MVVLGKSPCGLLEPIASALELGEHASVHQTIQDGGRERGVAEIRIPVGDDTI